MQKNFILRSIEATLAIAALTRIPTDRLLVLIRKFRAAKITSLVAAVAFTLLFVLIWPGTMLRWDYISGSYILNFQFLYIQFPVPIYFLFPVPVCSISVPVYSVYGSCIFDFLYIQCPVLAYLIFGSCIFCFRLLYILHISESCTYMYSISGSCTCI